jgi:Flp pilus assembly protein TadG
MIGKRDNMNKKGQALVEFILILPVLLLIVMAMIDVGNIFLSKYDLNKDLDTVTYLYQNNKANELQTYIQNQKITFNTSQNSDMTKVTVKKSINITAPILSNVLGKNYTIETNKTIYTGSIINGQ